MTIHMNLGMDGYDILFQCHFLYAFNQTGSQIHIGNLSLHSLQGDRIYRDYFQQILSNRWIH